jgi:flagellar hook protein FlgE
MSSSFSIALTGLESNSEAIDTTGNNLANMNTNGFKESEVDFKDLFSEFLGNATGLQIGLGVSIPTSNQVFTQGTVQTSTSPLAAAIQGNGFFVVSGANDQALYTRDGNFQLDSKGVLRTQTGEAVQGWTASSTGAINTADPIANITLSTGAVLPPAATQNFAIFENLNSQAVAGATNATVTAPMQIVDSLGNTHNLTVTFTKSSTTANTWSYGVTVPGADVSAGTSGTPYSLATGTLSFNSDGTLVSSTTATPTAGTANTAPISIALAGYNDGAADQTISWNLFDPTTGTPSVTQYAQTSGMSSSTQDGSTPAQLDSIGIQNGGQLIATYSNGTTKVEAQLAMAQIENPNSLEDAGNNNYQVTGSTAIPAIGVAETGGRGQILGSSLEGSNVDIAKEFTNLIVFQSGYQASSRVISTEQTIQTDLFNLIH